MKSWKTTVAGILLIVGAVALQLGYLMDSDPETVFSIEAIMVAVTGAGLFVARDNNVTSEEAVPSKLGKAKKK